MELSSASGQAVIAESLQRYCSTEGSLPLLLFPEEDTTNGRAGLLKFRLVSPFSNTSKHSFSIKVKLQEDPSLVHRVHLTRDHHHDNLWWTFSQDQIFATDIQN